jgi:hypothetical protein
VLCVLVAGFAVIAWSATPATAAPKKPKPLTAAFAGCRTLSVAYDPNIDAGTKSRVASDALGMLRKAKNPQLAALVGRTASTDLKSGYFADIGAWCKAHYAKDKVVRDAKFPTKPTSTA